MHDNSSVARWQRSLRGQLEWKGDLLGCLVSLGWYANPYGNFVLVVPDLRDQMSKIFLELVLVLELKATPEIGSG
jgi:hypothetical protein